MLRSIARKRLQSPVQPKALSCHAALGTSVSQLRTIASRPSSSYRHSLARSNRLPPSTIPRQVTGSFGVQNRAKSTIAYTAPPLVYPRSRYPSSTPLYLHPIVASSSSSSASPPTPTTYLLTFLPSSPPSPTSYTVLGTLTLPSAPSSAPPPSLPDAAAPEIALSESIAAALTESPEVFTPNPAFEEFLHGVLPEILETDEGVGTRAKLRGEGWMDIFDERNPPSANRLPESDDLVAMVLVRDGAVVSPSSGQGQGEEVSIAAPPYQPMPTYRTVTRNGPMRLSDKIMEKLVGAWRMADNVEREMENEDGRGT